MISTGQKNEYIADVIAVLNTAVGRQSGSLCLKVHQVDRQLRK